MTRRIDVGKPCESAWEWARFCVWKHFRAYVYSPMVQDTIKGNTHFTTDESRCNRGQILQLKMADAGNTDMYRLSGCTTSAHRGWCGLNRGMRLTPDLQARLTGQQELCVGVGRVTAGRRQLFSQQQGVAVELVQRVFEVQPCNGECVGGGVWRG